MGHILDEHDPMEEGRCTIRVLAGSGGIQTPGELVYTCLDRAEGARILNVLNSGGTPRPQVWFNAGGQRLLRDTKTGTFYPCFKLTGDYLPDTKRPMQTGRIPTEAEVAAALDEKE